jgi:MoaA/NifB/PqqE/SkfB family radical SAM enzyme
VLELSSLRRWQRLGNLARAALGSRDLLRLFRSAFNREGAVLQVENTNYCNYRCTYCATHSDSSTMTLPRGHMTLETFSRLLEEHPRATLVIIQGDGEPLLDPTLFNKIRLARESGRVTQVISNGSMLSKPEVISRLLDDGPDVLLFSIDVASVEQVMEKRRGMKYAEVFDGVRALSQARRKHPRAMVLGLLSIVYGPFNDDADAALRSFNELDIDVLFYKQLNGAYAGRIAGYKAPEIDGVPASTRRALNYWVSHQRLKPVAPCAYLKHGFSYFLWDGTETPCCVLNHPQYSGKDFKRDRLLDRWLERKLPSECEKCSFFAGYPEP